METVQQNGRITLFLVNSPLIYILFSLTKTPFNESENSLFVLPSKCTDRNSVGLSIFHAVSIFDINALYRAN